MTEQMLDSTPREPLELGLFKFAYSIQELIELLGISRALIYRDIRSGELKMVKFGGTTRILAKDLASYIASRSTAKTPRGWPGKNSQPAVTDDEHDEELLRAGGFSK
jgi:excisionase family DNA binding protein